MITGGGRSELTGMNIITGEPGPVLGFVLYGMCRVSQGFYALLGQSDTLTPNEIALSLAVRKCQPWGGWKPEYAQPPAREIDVSDLALPPSDLEETLSH